MRYFRPGFTVHPPLFVGWNVAAVSPNITLSNGLLRATGNAGGDGAVAATFRRATGKFYCELNMQTVTGGDTGGGFCSGAAVLANIGGSVANAIIQFKGGNVYSNGTLLFGNGSIAAGGILRCAYDADNHLAWLAFAGGNWNNNGAISPDAGTGGVNVSAWDTGGLFPCFACGGVTDQCTANFGASSFTYSLPSGFSNWNT